MMIELVLLALCCSFAWAANTVYVCSKNAQCEGLRSYNLPNATVYTKGSAQCDECKQITFAPEANVFIARISDSRAATVLSQLILPAIVLSVTPIEHGFYFIAVEDEDLNDFERVATQVERQKINFAPKLIKQRTNTLNLAERQIILNAEKDDILNSFSSVEYDSIMRKLSGVESFTVDSGTYTIRTRHSSTTENVRAAEYIYEYLRDLGYEVEYQSFRCQSGYNTQNIIGIKRGTTAADEIVVVGGHMDSTSPQTSNAPGAVDNASGADGMMLIARAFANVTLARTVHFMGFGCEEQGLIGSEYYCENSNDDIVAAITMDMIAYSNRYYGVMIEGLPNADVQNLMNLMQDNCDEYSPELTTTSRNFSFGSDHVSFQNCGIPAFLAIEQDETDYDCYHATCDVHGNTNAMMGTDIARAAGGVLYDIAKEN
eukprot:c4698_g1_i1.p1 GENE.c4698_g1_i1~~c4698_g1_i1.p1  ORF type:complete len:446 (+),score=35.22 c4698_g1_i1:50-1339(+)